MKNVRGCEFHSLRLYTGPDNLTLGMSLEFYILLRSQQIWFSDSLQIGPCDLHAGLLKGLSFVKLKLGCKYLIKVALAGKIILINSASCLGLL